MIKLGARRKIGSGRFISIWNDPWLCENNEFVQTDFGYQLSELIVSDLMLYGEREWNSTLVTGMFFYRDREQILSIPLSINRDHDGWFWNAEGMVFIL